MHRRAWKQDLIARVDQRVHAAAIAAPSPAAWPTITAGRDEYRPVLLHGKFLYDGRTLVWASTGSGNRDWVMTPMRRADGSIVIVNRGFAPTSMCPDRLYYANSPTATPMSAGCCG